MSTTCTDRQRERQRQRGRTEEQSLDIDVDECRLAVSDEPLTPPPTILCEARQWARIDRRSPPTLDCDATATPRRCRTATYPPAVLLHTSCTPFKRASPLATRPQSQCSNSKSNCCFFFHSRFTPSLPCSISHIQSTLQCGLCVDISSGSTQLFSIVVLCLFCIDFGS